MLAIQQMTVRQDMAGLVKTGSQTAQALCRLACRQMPLHLFFKRLDLGLDRLNAPLCERLYLSRASFDQDGNLVDDKLIAQVAAMMRALADWTRLVSGK